LKNSRNACLQQMRKSILKREIKFHARLIK
jgi:hypothetical protein